MPRSRSTSADARVGASLSAELALKIRAEALGELLKSTDPTTVGPELGTEQLADDMVLFRFAADVEGYPNWAWEVSVATPPGQDPAVCETNLLPQDGALLAPSWVPWSDRMAEAQAKLEAGEDSNAQDDAAPSDATEDDETDDDDDPDDVFSGIDIDELDESSDRS